MRSLWFLVSGFLLLASTMILAKLFAANYPAAARVATGGFIVVWLLAAGFNMWVGVRKAGYAWTEELPVFMLIFGLPAAAAVLLRWKLL